MDYVYGDWKKSTLLTLQRLKEENDKGLKPKASHFKNGSITAWLSIFKEHGEVTNGDGYQISASGLALMTQLQNQQFRVARVPRGPRISVPTFQKFSRAGNITAYKNFVTDETAYHVEVTGPKGLHISSRPSKVNAVKIIKLLTEIR